MKKISRLTALLLALLMMFSSVALASEDAIHHRDLTLEDYIMLVATAQEANENVGKKAETNQDGVAVHSGHNHLTQTVDTLAKGTVVTITSYATGWFEGAFWDSYWYGVSYEKDGKTKTGYIQTRYLDIRYEIVSEPWDETQTTSTLTFEVKNADSYVWQRGLIGEDGSIVWEEEPIATGAELTLETDVNNDFNALKYTYRCVAKSESGEVLETSDNITLVREDIAAWMTDDVTSEMLVRAINAPHLDSLVIEDEWMMHVRTGERFAYYNSTTNALISEETGKVLGYVIGNDVYVPRQ